MAQQKALGADLSLIDRLIDYEQSYIDQFRSGLRRDLEDLLNTNLRARSIPGDLEELDNSIINYGIVDLLTSNLSTQSERQKVINRIKEVVEQFEPRLMNVSISEISTDEIRSHTLGLKLVADTIIGNSTEEIIFHTKVDISTGAVKADVNSR